MIEFQDFIISSGEQDSIKCKRDYIRRFHYWWQYYGLKNHCGAGTFQLFTKKPARQISKAEEAISLGREATLIAKQMLFAG